VSRFKLEEQLFILVSVHDIRAELDEKELEAWQKLIRVLTHEIMNSVTPIVSLSNSLNNLLKSSGEGIDEKKIKNQLVGRFRSNCRQECWFNEIHYRLSEPDPHTST